MPELALDPSETRRKPAASMPARRRSYLRGALIFGVSAAALAGFAVAASSVMAELVAPPRVVRAVASAPSKAADWPDLKDGLPALAGAAKTEARAATPAPPPAGPRMAALSDPLSYAPPPAAAVSPSSKILPDSGAEAPSRPAPVVAAKPAPEAPTKRIPVPTAVATVAASVTAKPIVPSRVAAVIAPGAAQTVRARQETAAKKEEAPRPREETSRPRPVAEKTAEKPASRPAPAPASVAAAPAPEKPRKTAASHKTAPGAAAQTVKTASAEPEAEETSILGVKLPSLAPAGRKIQEGVSALGDAVRNAF